MCDSLLKTRDFLALSKKSPQKYLDSVEAELSLSMPLEKDEERLEKDEERKKMKKKNELRIRRSKRIESFILKQRVEGIRVLVS